MMRRGEKREFQDFIGGTARVSFGGILYIHMRPQALVKDPRNAGSLSHRPQESRLPRTW